MRKLSCKLHHGGKNEVSAIVMCRALCGHERGRKFESERSIGGEKVRVLSKAWLFEDEVFRSREIILEVLAAF